MSDFLLCELLGVRVTEVAEELPYPAIYYAEMRLAFVSHGLSHKDRVDAADQLLAAVAAGEGAQ